MKDLKVVWIPALDDPETETFALSVDGTDCATTERQHPCYNQDKKQCSFKHNHCAVKYEIGLAVHTSQCVWVSGPHRGGESDISIFRQEGGLADKIKKGKKAVADRGYRCATTPDVQEKVSLPSEYDPPELNNYKSRIRLRQETYNGRLKNFEILAETFTHGFDKHKFAMEAVIVIVQYQMDNGSPLYEV